MMSLTIVRVAHSCSLIRLGPWSFLTDPWWEDSPLYAAGEPRALSPGELPPLTAILVSHAHRDHCDLGRMAEVARDVPVLGNRQVAKVARRHGFTDVRELAPWQASGFAQLVHATGDPGGGAAGEASASGPVTVTATPAKHGVPELTFVIEAGGRRVFFGGDTLYIPELDWLPRRFGGFDLALLPVNGLRIRPLANRQVVMSAREAAELTAVLRPAVVVPQHYAFDSGPIGNALLTKKERDPSVFVREVARLAPTTRVEVLEPGAELVL